MSKGNVGDKVRFTELGLRNLRDDALVDEHEIVSSVPKLIVRHVPMDADEWPGYTEISYSLNQGYGITEESEYFAPDEFELVEKVSLDEAVLEFLKSARLQFDPSAAEEEAMIWAFEAGWTVRDNA